MYLNQVFVSKALALQLKNALIALGCPTENRVLILPPKDQDIIQGGIIIPGQAKDELPNKGVVILQGHLDEEYKWYTDLIETGRILTYGMYAGKEIEFNPEIFQKEGISIDLDKNKFTVLSVNEIIYSEVNNN